MMIDKLISSCDERFRHERSHSCNNCTYSGFCPRDIKKCGKCLELVHFPGRVAAGAPPRQYDCTHMADFYVCRYAYRYVSELIYAFRVLRDVENLNRLKVLSFGCGPCTDLLALDYLRQSGNYAFQSIEYRGVDYNKDVWTNIHEDLERIKSRGFGIKFIYYDAVEIINEIADSEWIPDLVVFQYFFSDMRKNTDSGKILKFVNTFSEYVNNRMLDNSYVVFNDINLSTSYGGGREFFDQIRRRMNNGLYDYGHFHNDARPNTYGYGRAFDKNNLFFDITPLAMYDPFKSCSSAQMLFKKGGT